MFFRNCWNHRIPAFLLLLLAVVATTGRAADSLIVPGKRIGAIGVGMPRAQVDKLLGTSDASYTLSPRRTDEVWPVMTDGKRDGEMRVQFFDGVASRISTTARRYATTDGLAIGASIASLRPRIPQLHESDYLVRRSGGVEVQCYADVPAGIGFEFDKGALLPQYALSDIYVFAAGKLTECGRSDDPRAVQRVGKTTNRGS